MFPEIRYFALRAPAGGRLLKFLRLTFGPRPFLGNLIGRPPVREEIERGDGAEAGVVGNAERAGKREIRMLRFDSLRE